MTMLGKRVRIKEAVPQEDFCVLLLFKDGTEKEMDLEPFLHGEIFEPIRNNPEMFRDIHIEGGTIAWTNGADIDPNVLYYDLKPAWMEEKEVA